MYIFLSLSISLYNRWHQGTQRSHEPEEIRWLVILICIHIVNIYIHTRTHTYFSLSLSLAIIGASRDSEDKTPANIRRLVVHISMYIVHIYIHARTHTYFSLSLSPCITGGIKGLRGAIDPQKSGSLGECLRTKSLYLWEREVGGRERRRKKMGGDIWVLHVTYDWGMPRMNEHTTSHMDKYECVVAHMRKACHVRLRCVTFE